VRVEFDRHSLRVDGRRVIVRSGSLHYFRLPARALWRDRIARMKDAGLNAVDVYYPWSYHAERPDEFDFAGLRDVEQLHDLIERAGLYLIARPGPYICAEIDFGGLPAWLLRDPAVTPRCRTREGYLHSRAYLDAVRGWFEAIVPRIAARANLLLFQIENEYALPSPVTALSSPLADLAIHRLGARRLARLASARFLRRLAFGGSARPRGAQSLGQHNGYMAELYRLARSLGVRVPIFHNDVHPWRGRQLDVDLIALDRYPVTNFRGDWRDDPHTFDDFAGDEAALDAHGRTANPVFYPELQAGWYDGWGGAGYAAVRESLGADGIDATTKAALAARATLWSYFVFAGGVTWGYQSSPDVYSSYDYGAPVGESGATGPRYEAVKRLCEFLAAHEADLAATDLDAARAPLCREHFATRVGRAREYVFLRNPTRKSVSASLPETERATLAPWETQLRIYDRGTGRLVAVSPELPAPAAAPAPIPPLLPRLERWRWSDTSPQLASSYDDSSWLALDAEAVAAGEIDIDALGLHWGFVWYRGTFRGALDRLVLDARHSYAVWLNGRLLASGDQLRNPLGVGADGARARRVSLRGVGFAEGESALVVLVESLGHNKAFADDGGYPRGIVSIDTGATRVTWRARGGLVRGERGLTPVVDFAHVERASTQEVVLPHGYTGAPVGVALYETSFRLEGVDPKRAALALAFDPGRGKANLYLNGFLLGRYWPERGPQRRFALPWGVLSPDDENQLAVALWKRSSRAALGKLRLELA
jgi:glycosyl hydrolase family 35/beta-galactosidase-like protein